MRLYKDNRNGNHYIVGNLGDTKYMFNKVMKFTTEENRMQNLKPMPYDPLIINDILEGIKIYLLNDINNIEFEI